MDHLLQNLLKLQTLEFGEGNDKSAERIIAGLRSEIPAPILAHYDRLRARGKRGLAAVRHQVCAECHMHIPIGTITAIMHATDIQLCGSCGRYLYLPAPAQAEAPPVSPPPKPAARARKRRVASHAS